MRLSRARCSRGGKLPLGILIGFLLIAQIAAQATYPAECANYAPPAVIKGNKIFVSTTGEYLPIKGINYYPRPNEGDLVVGNSQDFYTEAFRSSWERDIAQFQALGVNAIRLYAVDPGLNHDAFMCALKAAGIYVIVGLAADCENCAVQYQDPPHCYPSNLKLRGQFIIQQFARYENVLGFSAGNEVALSSNSYLGNLPCQKKFIRDMREYIQQCTSQGDMRHIPVGVVYADHERSVKAQYYNCRTNPSDDLENAEFIGINAYLHCDGSATDIDQLIGYKTLLQGFQNYGMTVPVLWTEFGCLNESFETVGDYSAQRNFLQVDALFSDEYRAIFNGGFVFEYSTEKVYSQTTFPFANFAHGNYGVGYFSPSDCNGMDIPCEYIPFPQFAALADRYAAVEAAVANEVTLSTYNPPAQNPPMCPWGIRALSEFTWPTDTESGFICPELVPVYCFGVPGECVTVPHPAPPSPPTPPVADFPTGNINVGRVTGDQTAVPNKPPTSSPVTAGPTGSPTTEPPRTLFPTTTNGAGSIISRPSESPSTSTQPTPAPTDGPTTSPTGAPTFSPTENPTAAPTFAPTTSIAPTESPTNTTTGPTFGTEEPSATPTTVLSPIVSPTASTLAPIITTASPTAPRPTTPLPSATPSTRPTASTLSPIAKPTASPTATEPPSLVTEGASIAGSDLDTVESVASEAADSSNITNSTINPTNEDDPEFGTSLEPPTDAPTFEPTESLELPEVEQEEEPVSSASQWRYQCWVFGTLMGLAMLL